MGYDFGCVDDHSVEFSSNAWSTGIIRPFLAFACRIRFLGGASSDRRLQALSVHPGPELRVPAENCTAACEQAGIVARFTPEECGLVVERLESALASAAGYFFAPEVDAWLDFTEDDARATACGEMSERELLREFLGFLRRAVDLGGFTVV